MLTEASAVQSQKAHSPIVPHELGMDSDFRDEHPQNAQGPISSKDVGIMREVSELQPRNAPSGNVPLSSTTSSGSSA